VALPTSPGPLRPSAPSRGRRPTGRGIRALGAVVALLLVSTAGCVRYEPDPGTIALTFDDGPHPTWTPQVLNILDYLQVKATFFVVGENVERYPGLVAEIQRRGHSVQNHTYTHPDLVTLSNDQVDLELRRNHIELRDAGVSKPNCLRPPYGSYDQRIDLLAEARSLELVLWDVDTRDWSRPGVPAIIDRATEAGSGDIILFHDGGGDRSQTVEALPEVILELDERGYDFQSLCAPAG
jgi:peptidoglycan/xylan/chitin deacetylase (PgdA/CDA1 family)